MQVWAPIWIEIDAAKEGKYLNVLVDSMDQIVLCKLIIH